MFYMVIRTENLTKRYGQHIGVQNLTLEVEPGEVYGLLGAAGAGKTSTVRMLLDFVRPSTGRALVLGRDAHKHSLEIRRQVGFLPAKFAFDPRSTAEACLRYLASLRGAGRVGDVSWEYVSELSRRFGIALSARMSQLSPVECQKMGLIQAFMHRPELLILDEPTRGLDAEAQRIFFQLVAEARAEGRTVFLATSSLHEAERACDRVAVIHQGALVAVERAVRLRGRAMRKVEMRFAMPVSPEMFCGLSNVENVRTEDNWMSCVVRGDPDALIKLASQYRVIDFISQQPTLEEAFKNYYGVSGYAL